MASLGAYSQAADLSIRAHPASHSNTLHAATVDTADDAVASVSTSLSVRSNPSRILAATAHWQAAATPKRVTYFYTGYYDDFSKFKFASFKTHPFTHVNVAFADITKANKVLPDPTSSSRWSAFNQYLHSASPPVRTLYSIQSDNFAAMAAKASRRATFIASAIATARRYGFNGIDLDWEFPSLAANRSAFSSLLKELRAAIAKEAQASARPALLLTAAVAAWKTEILMDYNVPVLNRALDWVNIMTYDLAGTWDGVTGEHTALRKPSDPSTSIVGTIAAWKSLGMSPSKMVIGLATYGHAFKLARAANHGVGAPITGASSYGDTMDYVDIVNKFIPKGATAVFDKVTSSMYAFLGRDWVGYDNPATIKIKSAYLKKARMAGYMFWAYNSDDAKLSLQRAATAGWP